MSPRPLAEEVGKKTPFDLPEEEAYLNVIRTHDLLSREFTALFRAHGLSEPLYNALRIVRARGASGVRSQTIGEDMVSLDPDITRIVDRLVRMGLVTRERSSEDRRVVLVRVTPEGRRLLDRLNPKVRELHRRQLGHLSERQLATLNRLLESARDGAPD